MQKSGAVLDADSETPGCGRGHASSRAAADARIREMHKRGHPPGGAGSERRIHAIGEATRLNRSRWKRKPAEPCAHGPRRGRLSRRPTLGSGRKQRGRRWRLSLAGEPDHGEPA